MTISKNMKGSFARGQKPKDSAWSDLAEAFTAAALNNIAGNNGNAAIKPVTIPSTNVKFDRKGTYTATCTKAIQVDWNALNTSSGNVSGSGHYQSANIDTVEYPVTNPGLSQAEIDAQIAAFQAGISGDSDWTSSNIAIDGVFITGDQNGHEDIIGMNGSTPVCAFHNKNNAFSRGDQRDFGLSGAAHSAIAALLGSTAKQNMINNYFAFLLRQFKTIVAGSSAAGSAGATTSGTIGNLGMKQKRGIPRLTAAQFKTDFDSNPQFRADLEACIKSRTTAVPSWRVVSTYSKTAFGVPSVACKIYNFTAGSIVNGSCSHNGGSVLQIKDAAGAKVCKITVRGDDNRIAQVLMQGHERTGNLIGENKMRPSLRKVIRKAIQEIALHENIMSDDDMEDLEQFVQQPTNYPGMDALPDADSDEFTEDMFDVEVEVVEESTSKTNANFVNEARWAKLAGILKD